MCYKKLFFPIGGGEELEERLYGALLIAKKFNISIDILKSNLESKNKFFKRYVFSEQTAKDLDEIFDTKKKEEHEDFIKLFRGIAKDLDLKISVDDEDSSSLVNLKIREGLRSNLVEQESKYCDLVIAATPPLGISTATFETAVLKSGKPVLMFPRVLKNFSTDSILVGWNNSIEASRTLTFSIPLLKLAKKVHIITSNEYVEDVKILNDIIKYLKEHEIEATYEIIKTTLVPGEALLHYAQDNGFDMIVAGAYGHHGLRELMFGGATRYLLGNTTLPVFMAH